MTSDKNVSRATCPVSKPSAHQPMQANILNRNPVKNGRSVRCKTHRQGSVLTHLDEVLHGLESRYSLRGGGSNRLLCVLHETCARLHDLSVQVELQPQLGASGVLCSDLLLQLLKLCRAAWGRRRCSLSAGCLKAPAACMNLETQICFDSVLRRPVLLLDGGSSTTAT